MEKNEQNYMVPYPDPDRPSRSVLIPVSYGIKKEISSDNDRIRKKPNIMGDVIALDDKSNTAQVTVSLASIKLLETLYH